MERIQAAAASKAPASTIQGAARLASPNTYSALWPACIHAHLHAQAMRLRQLMVHDASPNPHSLSAGSVAPLLRQHIHPLQSPEVPRPTRIPGDRPLCLCLTMHANSHPISCSGGMAASFSGTRSYIQNMFLPDASSVAEDLVKPAKSRQQDPSGLSQSPDAWQSMAADGAFFEPAPELGNSTSDAFFDARQA